MRDGKTPSLLVPGVVTYFPCATIARIDGGLVTLPSVFAAAFSAWPLGARASRDSPFQAARDLYHFRRIARKRSLAIYTSERIVPGFRRIDASLRASQGPP